VNQSLKTYRTWDFDREQVLLDEEAPDEEVVPTVDPKDQQDAYAAMIAAMPLTVQGIILMALLPRFKAKANDPPVDTDLSDNAPSDEAPTKYVTVDFGNNISMELEADASGVPLVRDRISSVTSVIPVVYAKPPEGLVGVLGAYVPGKLIVVVRDDHPRAMESRIHEWLHFVDDVNELEITLHHDWITLFAQTAMEYYVDEKKLPDGEQFYIWWKERIGVEMAQLLTKEWNSAMSGTRSQTYFKQNGRKAHFFTRKVT
jgi:hypothetical protein